MMTARETVREFLVKAILPHYRPRPAGGIREWVKEQGLVITGKENRTYAGQKVDPDRTPCVAKLIYGFLDPREKSRELFLRKPSQFSASFNSLVGVTWLIEHHPGNVLYVTDTGGQVLDFVRERVDPVLKGCRYTANCLEELADEQRSLTKSFGSMTWYFSGGQSVTGLTSKPLATVVLDEVERHPIISGTTTVSHARVRLTGADDGKLLAYSSPEEAAEFEMDEERGGLRYVPKEGTVLDNEFLSGTQERCLVPCPMCGVRQEIVWENIKFGHCKVEGELRLEGIASKWDRKRILEETFLLCVNDECRRRGADCEERCACPEARWNCGQILEKWKPWMVEWDRIDWVPAEPGDRERKDIYPESFPGRRSARISALYDIAFENLKWGRLVLEWIEAQSDPAKLRKFINHRLGRPFVETRHIVVTAEQALVHVDKSYARLNLDEPQLAHTKLPLTPWMVGITADVQQAFIKWEMKAYSCEEFDEKGMLARKAGEKFTLDWGVVPFDNERNWHFLLERLLDTPLMTPDGKTGFIRRDCVSCLIDCAYRTSEILSFCWQHPHWQPIWGEGKREKINGRAFWLSEVVIQGDKTRTLPGLGKAINVLWFAANHWEEEWHRNVLGQKPEQYLHPRTSPRLHLPADVKFYPGYLAEIVNGRPDYVKSPRGLLRELRWVPATRGPNDHADTGKTGCILWELWKEMGLGPPERTEAATMEVIKARVRALTGGSGGA